MEVILRQLISEVQMLRKTVEGMDERLKRLEAAYINNGFISFEVQNVWNKCIDIIKQEISGISFNTWISTIKPIDIRDKIIYLTVPAEFNKGILENRYSMIVEKAVHNVVGQDYSVKFSVEDMGKSCYSIDKSNKDVMQVQTSLKPKYTFESFVVGDSNILAYKSAIDIANNSCEGSRLLYIYGSMGIGKTHILQAVGNLITDNNPATRVKYITMETFINELILSIRDDTQHKFRISLLKNDVLIIDNLQDIEGKHRTQEEFHSIITDMLQEGKVVLLGCKKAPQDIFIKDEKFTAVFDLCNVCKILTPNLDQRIEILRRKSSDKGLQLSSEVINEVAARDYGSIRELNNELNRIISYSRITKEKIDVDMVRRVI